MKSKVPTWLVVIAILLAVVVIRTAIYGPAPVPVKAPETIGQRVYGSSLRGYTESDGRILVAYDIFSFDRKSVENEVRRFMRELTKAKRTDWNEVTISGYAQFTNKATGEERQDVAYTITFFRESAEKVIDWDRVDVRAVGIVEHAALGL
jgi:hypothetical protein